MVRSLSLTVKRALDLVVAATALLVLSPLLLLTALLILLEDGRPVFFRQTRAGRGGQPFAIVKFRSMTVNDAPVASMGAVTGTHPLVTKVGRVTRRTKIDELPQLLNVLTGDLSLVGPRPTLMEQTAEYDDFEQRRLSFKPGVTGWAQVCGGIYLPWEERIALDVWYIDAWSLGLDFKVLLRTVGVIVLGERLDHKALSAALEHERSFRHGAVRVGGWRSERPLG